VNQHQPENQKNASSPVAAIVRTGAVRPGLARLAEMAENRPDGTKNRSPFV